VSSKCLNALLCGSSLNVANTFIVTRESDQIIATSDNSKNDVDSLYSGFEHCHLVGRATT
jgi:hypothetical protein